MYNVEIRACIQECWPIQDSHDIQPAIMADHGVFISWSIAGIAISNFGQTVMLRENSNC